MVAEHVFGGNPIPRGPCGRMPFVGRIDLEREVPWLGRGPVRTASEEAAEELGNALGQLGFEVRALEGERVVSLESFFAEAQRGLGLEGCGPDWDTFARCRSAKDDDLPALLAVIWHRADHSAFFNLKVVAEAAHAFWEWDRERAGRDRQVEFFLLGSTRDFPRPGPG
jgi:hypothetical protein